MKTLVDVVLLVLFVGFAAFVAVGGRLRPAATAGGLDVIEGPASWYGEGYRGKTMANGEPFDPEKMTAAAWDWPLGSLVRVRHQQSGRIVLVEITDRGPARWTGCIIDLSSRAFRRLASQTVGRIRVEVTVMRRGPEEVTR